MNEQKKLAWTYMNQIRICPDTGDEIVQGKVDKYCGKEPCVLVFVLCSCYMRLLFDTMCSHSALSFCVCNVCIVTCWS